MSSVLCRRLLLGGYVSSFSRLSPLFSKANELYSTPKFFQKPSVAFYSSGNPGDENGSPPLVPQPPVLDKYLVPATVMATGAILSPGIKAMVMKPVYLWFYRRFYDLGFDVNDFLTGARRALYFVTGKLFKKDFLGLRDVLTPEVSCF